MNINGLTYFALAALFFAASCSKEAAEPEGYDVTEGQIHFKSSITGMSSSRGQDMTLERLESFEVTCFNTDKATYDEDGIITPHFNETTFFRTGHPAYGTYVSAPPIDWPDSIRHMRFVAFSPSIRDMREGNAYLEGLASDEKDSYFKIVNGTTETIDRPKDKSPIEVEYRLEKIRINPDISKQFDFVTADATGDRLKNLLGGVDLAFGHRLSQIELRAWGASKVSDFEIAGVRIGNPVVEGTFIFADDNQPENAATWEIGDVAVMDKVEYIFQPGDNIYNINSTEHCAADQAASIMGSGGNAMVLPTKNDPWKGLDDPNIGISPYKTDKMYFSILMRITSASEGQRQVYPYPGNKDGLSKIIFAVDPTGKILTRLYEGEEEGIYYTDPNLLKQYEKPSEGEIKEFGWAAVPVKEVDWKTGKRYIYTINYSDGVGFHDPEDPDPGVKIIKDNVSIDIEIADWNVGSSEDVTVPRK